ncbi:Calx-beta domain-containing protein [Baekduia sp. Peel2402]|uniref:Calx-beta domain-containing protein n=1 Tax=Baekduia sp. Peel2402 TaxID=3458296 RepID=UPI00403EB390
MSCMRPLAAAALALALFAPAASASVTVDPATRTVTTPRFTVAFDATNPEQLTSLQWAGIGTDDLASDGGVSACGDALETWGQSYGEPAPIAAMVRPGSRGTWTDLGGGAVQIDSQITEPDCSGFEGQLPVQTNYQFYGEGDQLAVTRKLFLGGPDPVTFSRGHLRPYVPRMPRSPYTHTLWNGEGGYNDSVATSCTLNYCLAPGWDGAWFAQHDPDTGRGLLVVRAVNDTASRLLIKNDNPSLSNSSSADFVPDVFDTTLSETEFLCFYTEATWPAAEREASKLPAWCGPSLTIRDARVSESAGTATLTVERSLTFGPSPRFTAVATDGTAKAGVDYGPPVAGTFADGAATATITIPIADDGVRGDGKSFTVKLADVRGASIGAGSATVTIDEDDPAPVPVNPDDYASVDTPTPVTSTGTTTKKKPTLPGSQFVSLPATRSCQAGRTFNVKLRQPKGHKIATAVLRLNGKVVKTVRGTRRLALYRVPRGTFTVTVAVTTTTGARATATHAYKACAAAAATR